MSKKHPSSLYWLSCVEMWERFRWYLGLAIFVLFLNEGLHVSKGEAASMFGTYTALMYFSPLFGGVIADRWLGYRRSVLWGCVFLIAGDTILTWGAATQHVVGPWLWIMIAVAAVGNGLFKPNISTMVGNLYPQGDSRRDAGFSIFYVGINAGALVSPFVAAYARHRYGWSAAFGCAAAGMLVGLLILITAWRRLAVADQRSSLAAVLDVPLPIEYEDRTPTSIATSTDIVATVSVAATGSTQTVLSYDALRPDEVRLLDQFHRRQERQRIVALLVMCAVVTFFWIAFQQSGSTLTFWARDDTLRPSTGLLSWILSDEEKFAAVNPFFVIVLTPPVLLLFAALRKRNAEPGTPTKIMYGMLFGACAFAVMVAASSVRSHAAHSPLAFVHPQDPSLFVSPLWLIVTYFLATIGELFLSPMGMSMVTKLAPRRWVGLAMGLWFLSSAIGNKLAGVVGSYWDAIPHTSFFAILVGACLFAAALIALRLRSLRVACGE